MDISHQELINAGSVDEIQKAIKKLKGLRDAMLVKNGQEQFQQKKLDFAQPGDYNSTIAENDSYKSIAIFEKISLIDLTSLPEEDETEWLQSSQSVRNVDVEVLARDRSFMDTGLFNIQFTLLNYVKGLIFEERTGMTLKNSSAKLSTIPKDTVKPMDWGQKPVSVASLSSSRECLTTSGVPSPIEFLKSEKGRRPVIASSPLTTRSGSDDLNNGFLLDPDSFTEGDFFVATPTKNIDTRTYTRPKKHRTPLDGNLRVTGANNTLSLSNGKVRSPMLDYTFNRNANLNETFIQEDSDSGELNKTIDISPVRKVTRNLSYIIHRGNSGNDSPKENSEDQMGSKEELNTTFTCLPEENASSPTDSNSSIHNISMEELHTMARLQEQSLKMSSPPRTISRKNTQVIMEFPNMDVSIARPPARTSSTDTYCVGQSNPESPGSSGLSSPLDSQSYDDIPSSDTFRRSMPNLAISKRMSSGMINGLSLAPPLNNLKHKNHYISDSKLAQPALNSRLSALKPHGNLVSVKKTSLYDHSNKELRISHSALGTANGQMVSQGLRHGAGEGDTGLKPVQQRTQSGLVPPRYSSIGNSRGIPVKQTTSASMLPPPGFSQTSQGAPPRMQSRIPAPGSTARGRFGRSTTAGTRPNNNNSKVPDWRDGCY